MGAIFSPDAVQDVPCQTKILLFILHCQANQYLTNDSAFDPII